MMIWRIVRNHQSFSEVRQKKIWTIVYWVDRKAPIMLINKMFKWDQYSDHLRKVHTSVMKARCIRLRNLVYTKRFKVVCHQLLLMMISLLLKDKRPNPKIRRKHLFKNLMTVLSLPSAECWKNTCEVVLIEQLEMYVLLHQFNKLILVTWCRHSNLIKEEWKTNHLQQLDLISLVNPQWWKPIWTMFSMRDCLSALTNRMS